MQHNVLSFNNWLREENQDLLTMLQTNMDSLQEALQGLRLACQLEITMVPSRVSRVNSAISHLIVEIHLLAILKGRN